MNTENKAPPNHYQVRTKCAFYSGAPSGSVPSIVSSAIVSQENGHTGEMCPKPGSLKPGISFFLLKSAFKWLARPCSRFRGSTGWWMRFPYTDDISTPTGLSCSCPGHQTCSSAHAASSAGPTLPSAWGLEVVLPESPAHLHPISPWDSWRLLHPGARDLFTMSDLPCPQALQRKAELLHWAPGTCDFRFTLFLPLPPSPLTCSCLPFFSIFSQLFFLFQGIPPPRDS